MEVAQKDDFITNVTISNKKPQAMRASDDAFLLHTLISGLYSDPMLAMVRETITNAWDAHKEAGINDPVEITVDKDKGFVVKDYGPGIPKDKFVATYGILGESTKRQNKEATGGFGLGCKAPLAYAQSFKVTSYSEGWKTVYLINWESDGLSTKPVITELLSLPTEETGLTVEIPINETDTNAIISNAKSVVFRGSIPSVINNYLQKLMNIESADHRFALLKNPDSRLRMSPNRMYILYGSVIYPVPEPNGNHNFYLKEYETVIDALDHVYTVLLIADPDTISLAPSREHVTMSNLTNTTIKELLNEFITVALGKDTEKKIDTLKKETTQYIRDTFKQEDMFFDEIVWKTRFHFINLYKKQIDLLANKDFSADTTTSIAALENLMNTYGKYRVDDFINSVRPPEWTKPSKAFLSGGRTFLPIRNKTLFLNSLFRKKLYKRLYKSNPEYFKGGFAIATRISKSLGDTYSGGIRSLKINHDVVTTDQAQVLRRKEIVLSHTVSLSYDRTKELWAKFMKQNPQLKELRPSSVLFTVVRVPKTAGAVEAIKKTLEDIGCTVYDMTIDQPRAKKTKTTKEYEKVFGGFNHRHFIKKVDINYVLDDVNKRFDPKHRSNIKDPVWFYPLHISEFSATEALPLDKVLSDLDNKAVQWAMKTYPDQGILVSAKVYDQEIAEYSNGARNVVLMYLEHVAERLLQSKNSAKYIALTYTTSLVYGSNGFLSTDHLLQNRFSTLFGISIKYGYVPKPMKDLVADLFKKRGVDASFGLFARIWSSDQTSPIYKLNKKISDVDIDDFDIDTFRLEVAKQFLNEQLPSTRISKLMNDIPGASAPLKTLFNLYLKEMKQ